MKASLLTYSILAAVLLTTSTILAQYDPHPKGIDYSESYRGQYHFSPKSEWMNDINALMYLDGKYHGITKRSDDSDLYRHRSRNLSGVEQRRRSHLARLQ